MEPPSEPDNFKDIAKNVDSALESLWRGDCSQFEELLDPDREDEDDADIVLKGFLTTTDSPAAGLGDESEIRGYRIMNEIGRGGMGVVYKALQEGTKRIVAVKVMLAGPFASDITRRRFDREVELAARLRHPSIVRILESGKLAAGQRYYAMDHVYGVPLNRYLEESKIGTSEIFELFIDICDAVEHAHSRGVIHRDLKPGNVLVDEDGKPHILDFGLAKAAEGAENESWTVTVSSPGQVLGTLRYLSPEQASGRPDEIDVRTDVYALGVMMYEAVTGSPPFDTTGRASEIIQRIVETPPRRPSSLSPTVDNEVETIILRALEKEKARRYQSPSEFGEDLRRYLAGEPILARRPSSLYILRKRLSRHRKACGLAAAAVIVIVAAVFGSIWIWHHDLARGRQELLKIQIDLEAGRTELSVGSAESAYDQHPQLAEAPLVFAQAQLRMARERGDDVWKESAIKLLQRGLSMDPPQWSCGALLAEVEPVAGDLSEAECLALALAQASDEAEVWYHWSFATLDFEKAVIQAKEAVAHDPGHRLAWERLAHLCLQTGDTAGAVQAARTLVKLGRDPYEWCLFEGNVFTRHGDYREAIRVYSEAASQWPHKEGPLRFRAAAWLFLKEYDKAIKDSTAAAQITGSAGDWERYRRATPLWITGRLDEAAEAYREFCRIRSYATYGDARLFLVLRELAQLRAEAGRTSEVEQIQREAEVVLAAARDTAPQGSWLAKILACLAGELSPEDLANAADPYNREQVCESFFYAAERCLLQGRDDDACRWFRKCAETDIALDLDSANLDPMNEFHLALWRLDSLCGDGADEN